jgi:predicted dehydrogenase
MPAGPRTGRFGRRPPTPQLALAGAGYIAVVHALAAPSAGMRVRAVASAGGTSARHLAGGVDARRCRPDELPAGADVLVVATPAEHHVELALQGRNAGARVLVEKPLAPTLAEADRLVAAADLPGPALRCAENLLHAPHWRELSRRRPALGTLTHLSVRTMQPPPDWGHFALPLRHGGVLFDLGPHPIALALEAAGEPAVGVSCRLGSTRDDGADDDAALELRFGSGLRASLVVSWTAPEVTWDLQAASDTGVLRLELLPEIALEHDGEPVQVPLRHDVADPRLEQLGYVDQLLDLVADDPVGQTMAAARQVLEVICAAYDSAGRDGAEVALPFSGDRGLTPLQLWRGVTAT